MGLRIPSKVKTVVMVLLSAGIFGTVGYMIVPQSAKSALSQADKDLQTSQGHLQQSRQAGAKLQAQLEEATEALAAAELRVDELTESDESGRAALTEAEQTMASLNAQLTEAKTANKSMRKEMGQAQQQAAESKAQAEKAQGRTGKLEQELAAVTQQRDRLASAEKGFSGEKAKLTQGLRQQKRANADLFELLGILELRPVQAIPGTPSAPAEQPITVKELAWRMGHPTLVFQKGQELRMHWGSLHTARAVDGVVTVIDDTPATRAALAEIVQMQPCDPPQAGAWRFSPGKPFRYVDMVAMFGRPEGNAGTGREFVAWWSVGAWGRKATAKVVDGVVKEFDGREADASAICELVRHRAEAYRSPNRQAAQAARRFYEEAARIVGEDLRREAAFQAREGWNLKQWQLAPFESVGCWIAPVAAPGDGAVTVRAAVDRTWVNDDGSVRRDQRYVVVTFAPGDEGYEQAEYAIFRPRD